MHTITTLKLGEKSPFGCEEKRQDLYANAEKSTIKSQPWEWILIQIWKGGWQLLSKNWHFFAKIAYDINLMNKGTSKYDKYNLRQWEVFKS